MYQVRLTRVASTHDHVRTPSVTGVCAHLPEVGRSFLMTAPPVDAWAAVRVVVTTEVLTVSGPVFTTENSVYRLDEVPFDA